jgi:hypothetical protein
MRRMGAIRKRIVRWFFQLNFFPGDLSLQVRS